MGKQKSKYLIKGEDESKLTSKQIADMIQDCFLEQPGECVSDSVVGADEYDIVVLHREELAANARSERQEFGGDVARLELEICRLRATLDAKK